jgi:YggT family protein
MIQLLHFIFVAYTIMLGIRIIASWFPSVQGQRWLFMIARCTDPYLNIFRRLVPPIGGVLDLSPMLGFFTLQLLEMLLYRIFR